MIVEQVQEHSFRSPEGGLEDVLKRVENLSIFISKMEANVKQWTVQMVHSQVKYQLERMFEKKKSQEYCSVQDNLSRISQDILELFRRIEQLDNKVDKKLTQSKLGHIRTPSQLLSVTEQCKIDVSDDNSSEINWGTQNLAENIQKQDIIQSKQSSLNPPLKWQDHFTQWQQQKKPVQILEESQFNFYPKQNSNICFKDSEEHWGPDFADTPKLPLQFEQEKKQANFRISKKKNNLSFEIGILRQNPIKKLISSISPKSNEIPKFYDRSSRVERAEQRYGTNAKQDNFFTKHIQKPYPNTIRGKFMQNVKALGGRHAHLRNMNEEQKLSVSSFSCEKMKGEQEESVVDDEDDEERKEGKVQAVHSNCESKGPVKASQTRSIPLNSESSMSNLHSSNQLHNEQSIPPSAVYHDNFTLENPVFTVREMLDDINNSEEQSSLITSVKMDNLVTQNNMLSTVQDHLEVVDLSLQNITMEDMLDNQQQSQRSRPSSRLHVLQNELWLLAKEERQLFLYFLIGPQNLQRVWINTYEDSVSSSLSAIIRSLQGEWPQQDRRLLSADFFQRWCKFAGVVDGIQNCAETLKQDLTSLTLKSSKGQGVQARLERFQAQVRKLGDQEAGFFMGRKRPERIENAGVKQEQGEVTGDSKEFIVINKALWDFLASIYNYDVEMFEESQ